MYVMFSNCRSSNLTHKNIRNNVGSLIGYKPKITEMLMEEKRKCNVKCINNKYEEDGLQ